MSAPDLATAAGLAYDNLDTQWVALTLKPSLQNFWSAINPLFVEQTPNDHPISNWIALIAGVASECPAAASSADLPGQFQFLNAAAQYVYRICWLANYLEGQGLITSAQATAVLAAFNSSFP